MLNDTIVALATPPMVGALAIIRVSGANSLTYLEKLLVEKAEFLKPRHVYFKKLYHDGKNKVPLGLIDEATVIYYKGPSSYTGEDSLEIIIHGSPLIAEELIETFVSFGAVRATGGEFSLRSYIHGKQSLLAAEAVNDIILAPTILAKNTCLKIHGGESENEVREFVENLKLKIANLEVNIDYPEYDFYELDSSKVTEFLTDLLNKTNRIITHSINTQLLVKGINVAIVGRPNVGKSSILNLLVGEEKAIVTNIPGTTRDVVEGNLSYEGFYFHFIDTAGIRVTEEVIEKMGIEKSYLEISKANFVLIIEDSLEPDHDEVERLKAQVGEKPYLIINNKSDDKETRLIAQHVMNFSTLKKDAEPLLKEIINELKLSQGVFKGFVSARDIGLLKAVAVRIEETIKSFQELNEADLYLSSLYAILHIFQEFLGDEVSSDIQSTIFSHFCVGK